MRPLAQAPDAWQRTQREIASGIAELKNAIRHAFDDEREEELIAEIDHNLGKLDSILDHLDDRLAHALKRAHEAVDTATRANELKNAKTILSGYISYVSSEPLIAGIDANPFGVQINLRQRLTDSLRQMARAIGK